MNRRNFIRLNFLGVSAAMLTPALVLANSESSTDRDIYYTKDYAGRWAGKTATHLPSITVEKNSDKTTVKVVTAHEMKAYEHSIVKHTLLDKNDKFIADPLFNPSKDQVASSEFSL
ncbi:MAG: hypothetical protein WAX77_02360 [Methylococcaceae bacterium]